MPTQKRKGSLFCLYASNAMVYAFNALFYCFLPIYFNDLYSSEQAGIILSIGPAVCVIAPMFWGVLADRAKYKNTVLISVILISAVFFFLLKIRLAFLPMCFLVAVVMLFMSPIAAIIDAITLEHSENAHISYGPIRVMGTLGFGGISLISGLFTGADINVIFYIFVGMAIVCSAALMLCPQIEGHAHKKNVPKTDKTKQEKSSPCIGSLIRDKRLMLLILFMLVLQFAYSFYSNFYPTYLTGDPAEGALGLPQWVWGLAVLLTVAGEIPFFFLYNKLFDRFGIRTLLTVTLIGSIVRYVLLGVFSSPVIILAVNVFTGFLVTVATYCGATYITRFIAPELQATGQNFMYCIGQGIPRVLGGVVGGIMNAHLGAQGSMLLSAGAIVLFTILFFATIFRDHSEAFAPRA
ncbi:MAG: MFS transporter [Clostridia bacterium]|nr:MFS transporter [Clostridia bacterium]